MDGVSTLGAVGSIIGIIDVASRALFKLYEIKRRLADSDIRLISLTGELSASKLALQQIEAFLSESLPPDQSQHFQVQLDLDATLCSCRLLIEIIDQKVSLISLDDASLATRLKLVLDDKNNEVYLGMLSRQITALHVMINTLKCRDPEAQRTMLHSKENRQVLDEVKDHSSSLIVLYDNASGLTGRSMTTTGTSKFSLRFPFDKDLLKTDPYQRAFRSLLRRSKSAGAADRDPRDRHRPWYRSSIPANFRTIGIARYVIDLDETPSKDQGQAFQIPIPEELGREI